MIDMFAPSSWHFLFAHSGPRRSILNFNNGPTFPEGWNSLTRARTTFLSYHCLLTVIIQNQEFSESVFFYVLAWLQVELGDHFL